jgi:hypothetical protein
MNPLLFADWRRINRLFIRVMWAVAVVMVCVVCIALAAPTPKSHAAPATHPVVPAAAPHAVVPAAAPTTSRATVR